MKTLLLTFAILINTHSISFAADKESPKSSKNPVAVIKTNMGSITITLFKDKSPLTVENFIGLAKGTKTWKDPKSNKDIKGKSLYKGTIFHRVIPDFMIQGGDPLGQGIGGPGYQFQDEFSPLDNFNRPGILAMANAGPNTNGSQFFITVAPTPHLNQRHTIFGEVTKGLDVVIKISKVQTGAMDKPVKDVKIESVSIQN
jgi:peptidyl-prolyl cis-trans isomerase A (cyclophilin A)